MLRTALESRPRSDRLDGRPFLITALLSVWEEDTLIRSARLYLEEAGMATRLPENPAIWSAPISSILMRPIEYSYTSPAQLKIGG